MSSDNAIVYLGLGSNLGDRSQALQDALDRIAMLPDTRLLRCSSIYETEPWGDEQQESFLNCVLEISTGRAPLQLLDDLKQIERAIGRMPERKYGPRIIDIDILLYEKEIVQLEHLRIPHPLMTDRRFVMVPLSELTSTTLHPQIGNTISELADICTDHGTVCITNVRLHLS